MNLKLHFASLSIGASVDQQTGNLSVFDVVDEIRIPQLPITMQAMVIALSLTKSQPESFSGKLFIHLLTPDGRQQMIGNGEIHVPAEQRRMKAVFRLGGFPLAHFGMHRFVVSWLNESGAKVGEALLDFDVIQVTQVAQGVPPQDKPPISH